VAIFGVRTYWRRPHPYDLVELWGGTTWLLAVLLRWLWPNLTIVHHSNGIEQHRVVVEQASGLKAVDTSWFQADLTDLYDRGLEATDAIVTVGNYDVPFLRKQKFVPEERIYAIENPLPSPFIGQTIETDRPARVGFCGSWIPRKGLHVMRSDLPSFLERHPSWTFSVVGSQEHDVVAEFPKEVRPQIEVIPFLEREALIEWYHSLAIFALPSIYESFGMVTAEAMACGAAAVTTNVGFGFRLEHGEEAYILPEARSPRLREALSALAADQKKRRLLARAGYERVQDLTWNRAVDRLETVYESFAANDS
jgi:glycosyltransferase involved in cell wall biosynthesis